MLKRAFVALACTHAALALAAPEGTFTEADYFAEQPVVLSASRLSQPVSRAPAAVTVITREMIEASGFRHLVDVLRLVPGFVVGWAGGNMPAATYLGLSDAFPHWMQIMVDGRSVYNPAYGHTTWRGIPLTLDDVDRIEVVRGPNAASDGLNSMLGTVHIYTRHSAATVGGMGLLAGGDKQYREANLRYGAETGGGSWRVGVLGREDERHGVDQDHATDVQLSFRGDFQPTIRDDLMLQFGTSKGFWQGSNVGQLIYDDQHAYYLSGYASLQWSRALGEGRSWSLQAQHTFNQNEEDFQLPLPFDPQNGNYRTAVSGLQFTYLDQRSSEWRTTITGEYRINRVRLPALLNSDGYIKDDIFRLAGAAEWTLSTSLVAHAGGMLEYHSDLEKAYLSPRLAMNWLPSSANAFRVGASKGISAFGLYANHTDIKLTAGGVLVDQSYLSTSKLDPEEITSFELGYLFSRPDWGVNLDARVFHNRISDIVGLRTVDFIDADGSPLDADGRVRTYINQTSARQRGVEYQLRWQAGPKTWLVLAQSFVSSDANTGENYTESVPPQTLSLLAAYPVAGIDASLGYYHISEMFWIGGDRDKKSKYNRLDLRLAKGFKTVDGTIETALVVQSLLGEEFESFAGYLYPQQYFKRRAYLSLKYEFR